MLEIGRECIERDFFSSRTNEALAKRKADGTKLVRPVGASKNLHLDKHAFKIHGYLAKGINKVAIAKLLDVSPRTLYVWLKVSRPTVDSQIKKPLTLSVNNAARKHWNIMKKIALSLIALCTSLVPLAQELSGSEVARLQTYLFDELTKQNFVKLNRVTKQGELSDCEAEFQYVYRDIRARKGAPVVLTGSFSSSWSPGKIPSFMFKINAAELDMKETKWNITAPPYINVTVKNLSFKPYKFVDFVCETGGRCVGFEDKNFKINMAVLETQPFDATLSWSLVENGMDNSVKLSAIGNPLGAKQALEKFFACNLEINQKLIESLKEKGK